MNLADLIDVDRYPILEHTKSRDDLIESIRRELAHDGCAVLKGFASEVGLSRMLEEANAVSDRGHKSGSLSNAYFTKDDPSLPKDDPRRQFFERSNCFISADNFPATGPIRSVYAADTFSDFVRDCLQEDAFYPYADPLADVVINAAEAGNGFPWHFDTNNFTVTLALQNAERGGAFEYAPNIRRGGENFDEVKAVLEGTSDKVTTIHLEPGDLQIFRGRYSLHRVAPLEGSTPRFVVIYSWVDEPGMVGTPARCKELYGRALPIHYEQEGVRADAYID